jgi:PAS domain S-box-containing protein
LSIEIFNKQLQLQSNLLDLSMEAIFAWDLDGAITYWNKGAEKMYGFTREEAIGHRSHDLLKTVHSIGIDESKAMLARDRVRSGEIEHTTKDGRKLIIETSHQVVVDETGKMTVLETNRDVTERRKVEQELHNSWAKLDAAFECMTDAVFISDQEGNFINYNNAFATYHRFRDKAECLKTLAEYPDILEVCMDSGELASLDRWAVPRALRGETVTDAEYMLKRKDTGETWVGSYNFAPIRDKDGAITGSVVIGRDITERKRTEEEIRKLNEELELKVQERTEELNSANQDLTSLNEELMTINEELHDNARKLEEEIESRKGTERELQQSQQYISDILASITDMFVVLDRQWRVTYVNQGFATRFKKTPEELLGRNYLDTFSEIVGTGFSQNYTKTMSERVPTRFEAWSPYLEVCLDVSAYPCQEGMSIYLKDINEKKQMEQKIEDALEFNRALVESPTFAIYAYNSSGRCIFTNESGARIAGGTKEQILQLNFQDYEHWMQNGLYDAAQRVLLTGTPEHLELQMENLYGKRGWWGYAFSSFISGGEPHLLLVYENITERKMAEENIRLSEERFAKAFHLSPTIGVIRSLEEGINLDVNDNFLRALEYERDEVIGHAPKGVGYWVDEEAYDRTLEELRRTGECREIEVKLRTKSGKIIHALFSAFITEINGEPCALISYIDITERKRMEEDLRRSESQLRLIIDTVPSIMTCVDSEKRYKLVNKAYEEWHGKNRAEIQGEYIWEVIGKETFHKLQPDIDAVQSGEKIFYEIELPNKDGLKRYFYTVMVPEIDDHGIVRGHVSLSTDMTEFRVMEHRIADALEFNQRLLDSSPVGISIYDSAGQWIYVNDAGANLAGGQKDALMAMNINDRESWQRNGLLDLAMQVLETGVNANKEIYFEENVFGNRVWFECNLSRFTSKEELSLLIIYHDITERKLAEEKISKLNLDLEHRADELARINKELESFNYSISHDLRAPLRAINGFSQILYTEHYEELDEKGREYLQIICSECNRMSDLINGLLSLSRLSRKEVALETVDLSAMVEIMAEELQRRDTERQAEFIIAPGIVVDGDKALLQSVLQNLLDNAWKFTGKHEKARIEFGITEQEDKKIYFVRDNGAGFDMKYAGKLFGIFQRLHGVDEFPGNGVGLAIVQRIIHHHGGHVWAESEVDKGATFYFTLHEQAGPDER